MIDVRRLTKSFGENVALVDLTFQVAEGEVFGFLGPNGAGKTTTLRILATLLEPTGGEALVDGLSVGEDTEAVRQIIGYMPDQFGLYDGVTVEEYLEFFASAFRLSRSKRVSVVRDVMALTDLGAVSGRMVSTLSRGVKQRLCLAKTLIHDPKVLLLDEPASALDPRARIELRVLLKELGRMGKTILISSHILTELSDLCTSVGIIEKGRLLECGPVGLLERQQLGSGRVKITLSSERLEVGDLLRSAPGVDRVVVDREVVGLNYRGAPDDFHKVLRILVDNGIPVVSVEHESGDLESLFLKVTRGDVQ